MIVNILGIVDDTKCSEVVRRLRWPEGVRFPHCDSAHVVGQVRSALIRIIPDGGSPRAVRQRA